MTHDMDDLCLRKRHLQQRQEDLVERHLVGEKSLAVTRESIVLGAREIVIAKQGRDVAVVSRPALSEILWERLGSGKEMVGQLAQLAEKRQLSTCEHGGMAAEDLLEECRSRAREADDENGLRDVLTRLCARQQVDVFSCEELFEGSEERLDCVALVAQSASFRGQLALA